jgi:hypothetical protein
LNIQHLLNAERADLKERHLVRRLSRADPDALREIYNRYKNDRLTADMADSILLEHNLAEDSAQEALAAACHQLPKLKKLSLFHSVSSSLDQNRRHKSCYSQFVIFQ